MVSYNLLSSHLAGPDHFPACDPVNLKADFRFEGIKRKLEVEIENEAIIALQEVSVSFAGPLHTFFLNRGYYLIVRHYGAKFNDYMGVGVAVPIKKYNVISVDSKRIADKIRIPRASKPGFFMGLLRSLWQMVLNLLILCKFYAHPYNAWDQASFRWNIAVSVTLEAKEGPQAGQPFLVSTYHMPCAFKHHDMMIIHGALVLKHVQDLAAAQQAPYVLMGDFNWKPLDAMHELYLQGSLPMSHPHMCAPPDGPMEWPLELTPVRSAYREHMGSEPDYTNNALVKNQPHFVECLDYIFVSDAWKVASVLELPSREEAGEPMPTADEPSDHLLIAASLSF